MKDRIPGAPGQYKAVVAEAELLNMQSGKEFIITMTRDDQPLEEGTPYSKAAVLPDELAEQLCPGLEDPTPADAFQALRDMIYPVGAIYLSVLDADPADIFGGTWEKLKDRFLLGAGDVYKAGATGGEEEHTLTVKEMPNHSHKVTDANGGQLNYNSNGASGSGNYGISPGVDWDNMKTTSVGSGQPHNNMPPYLAVHMWKRVA